MRAFLNNPQNTPNIKKLMGQKDFYRLRVGDVRIIFEKIENSFEIKDIGFRGEIYK